MPPVVPVIAVVGATASGKTELSLDLAERLGGEVVNTDAMQVYRGMDIGTAKLPVAERRGIPHHLLDTLDVREPATVAQFQAWARAAIADIRGRGASPVLVGGSALYVRAIYFHASETIAMPTAQKLATAGLVCWIVAGLRAARPGGESHRGLGELPQR